MIPIRHHLSLIIRFARLGLAAVFLLVPVVCLGQAPVVLANGAGNPGDLLLDNSTVYWGDVFTGQIRAVSKNPGGVITTYSVNMDPGGNLVQDNASLYFVGAAMAPGGFVGEHEIFKMSKSGGLTSPIGDRHAFGGDLAIGPAFGVLYYHGGFRDIPTPPDDPWAGTRVISSLSTQGGNETVLIWDENGATANAAMDKANLSYRPGQIFDTPSTDSTFLYWSELTQIWKMPLIGGLPSAVVTGRTGIRVIATPTTGAAAGSIFWTEGSGTNFTLMRRKVGGQIITVLSNITSSDRCFAVDGDQVYSEQSGGLVQVSIDGGAVTVLAGVAQAFGPIGVAVDSDYVYWGNLLNQIMRISRPSSPTITMAELRVGNQVSLDLSSFKPPGTTLKLVGKLPKGLTFNAVTDLITGIISGSPGTYSLSIQVLQGTTLVNTIPFPITVLPFPSTLLGSFEGILEDTNSMPVGVCKITITQANKWSGTLDMVGSAKRSAKGSFILGQESPLAPISAIFAASGSAPAVTINVLIDADSPLISGTLRGFRMASGAENPSEKLSCVLVFDAGVQDGVIFPAGLGWATGTMSNKGIGAFKGMLGDGTAVSIPLRLSATGQAVLWVQPYSNKNSYIGGIITLSNMGQPSASDQKLEDHVWWSKAADSMTLSYPSGFPATEISVGTSRWIKPATVTALGASLGWENDRTCTVVIDGAGLSNATPQETTSALPTAFTLNDKYNLTTSAPVNPPLVAWVGKAVNTTGAFTGSFTLPAEFAVGILPGTAAASGVLIQDESWGGITGCGLIKVPVSGIKGSFRTAVMVLQQ